MAHRRASELMSESSVPGLIVHRGLHPSVASSSSEPMDSAFLVVYFSTPILGMSHPASLVCLKWKVCLNRHKPLGSSSQRIETHLHVFLLDWYNFAWL